MKKIAKCSFVFFLFLLPQLCFSQLVAIIGINGTSPDGISFVALEDIPGGTTIYFTETEHLGGGVFNTGEGVWDWKSPAGGIAKGQVVVMQENAQNVMTTTCTTPPCESSAPTTYAIPISISGLAESVYAYSDTDNDPSNGTTEIYSVHMSEGALPGGENPLIFSPNAIVVDGLATGDHAQYAVSLRSPGPTSKADLENPANYTEASGFVALSTTAFANISLPVELLDFTARILVREVALNWTTASEINNNGFEIENSTDGINWDNIGFLKGNGNSVNVNKYNFIHKNPKYSINYYRLKQIDFDGQFEYSKTISISLKGKEEAFGEFYPNPSQSGMVNLDYYSIDKEKDITVSVFDLTGKLLIDQIHQIVDGQNNFNFSSLIQGIYMVKLGDKTNPIYRKLIITKR